MNMHEKNQIIEKIYLVKKSLEEYISEEWDGVEGWDGLVDDLRDAIDQVQESGTGQSAFLDNDLLGILDSLGKHPRSEDITHIFREFAKVKTVQITIEGGIAEMDFIPYGVEVVIEDKDALEPDEQGPKTYVSSPLGSKDDTRPAEIITLELTTPHRPPVQPNCITRTHYATVEGHTLRAVFQAGPFDDNGDDFIRLDKGTKNAAGGHDWTEIPAVAGTAALAQHIAMECERFFD